MKMIAIMIFCMSLVGLGVSAGLNSYIRRRPLGHGNGALLRSRNRLSVLIPWLSLLFISLALLLAA